MKKMLLCGLILLMVAFCGFSQSKTSIVIKEMTIENGDTTVNERIINSDDENFMLNDSLFGGNNRFIFFNRDYSLDTNFEESFDQIIHREMKDFFQNFNATPFGIPGKDHDFFSRPFDFDFDTVFNSENLNPWNPDTSLKYQQQDQIEPARPLPRNMVTTEDLIIPDRLPLEGYSVKPGAEEGSVMIVCKLDSKKTTQILLKNSEKKTVYKEKIPSSKGIYTRIFDFSTYDEGTYYLELRQGKKFSASSITVPGSNKNNFQFIF